MSETPLVAATRRMPQACEERLAKAFRFRPGDDQAQYTPASLAAHVEDADALIVTPVEAISADAIAALPARLKIIATFSVGFEHVDLAAARARKLPITNTPGVLTDATADVALLLMLAASRRAHEGEAMVRTRAWTGIRPTQLLGRQITGKNLGIVGMGRIGAATAVRARACGMRILYHNRQPAADAHGARYVPRLEEMLPECDVLSLHCPLTPDTRGLLNAARLALLPRGAIVVNTARGPLVDDDALIAALRSGQVGAAGLDVFANEPTVDERYASLPNAFLLPHLGSATVETRTAMGMLAIDNVEAVLHGREPPNRVA